MPLFDPDALLVTPTGEPWSSAGPMTQFSALSPAARFALSVLVSNRIRAGRGAEISQGLSLLAAATLEHAERVLLDPQERLRVYESGFAELIQVGIAEHHGRDGDGADIVTARFNRVAISERRVS